jgi:hypothetical protein
VEKIKEVVLKAIIQIVAGVLIAVVSVAWTNRKSDNQTLRRDVDHIELTKVDKEELNDYVKNEGLNEYINGHDERHKRENETYKDFILWLKDEMKELRQDVRDIKNNN